MRFNASKCYVMSLARNPPSSFFYSLDNTILQNVSQNPYLGLQFSSTLSWSPHINSITKKANSTLGFLRRNLKHCPTSCKRNAYLALVRPLMEYGAIIWDPYQKQDVDKLERVQRVATRFIANDYRTRTPGFVTELLQKHGLTTLQERRGDMRLIFFFKVVEGLVPAIPPERFLIPQRAGRRIRRPARPDFLETNPIQNYTRNNDRCYKVPESKTQEHKHSFFPKTIVEWNQLDDRLVNSGTTEAFKQALATAKRC